MSNDNTHSKKSNPVVAKPKSGARLCRDGKLRRKSSLEVREDVLARLECEGLWAREGIHNLTDMIRWALHQYITGIEKELDGSGDNPHLRSGLSEARKRAWDLQTTARAEKDGGQ